MIRDEANDMIEDEALMALADGELSGEEAARLRARMAGDPALAERFALFAETRALLGEDTVDAAAAHDPDVVRLAAAIREADAHLEAPMSSERRFTVVEGGAQPAPPREIRRPVARFRVAAPAIAASLALVVGGLVGYGVGRQGGAPAGVESVVAAASAPAAVGAISRALEGSASGQTVAWSDSASGLKGAVAALSSHKVDGDRFCREYEIRIDGRSERAVALGGRDAGGAWRTEMVARAGGGDGYAKASGETLAESALVGLGSAGALSEDEEAALIKGHWAQPK